MRAVATAPAARGLTDDAAVLDIGRAHIVLTHDQLAEGVHVLAGTDPADMAWKLVARTLSDLAAKGAEPLGVLLGHDLTDDAFDRAFAGGLAEALAAHGAALLGGDCIRSGGTPRRFGMTAIGRADGPVPARSGARPGDALWVTGTIGAAMLGHAARAAGRDGPHVAAYLRPRALLREGRALRPQARAMMDVSDGLLADTAALAAASGCACAIDLDAVPVPDGVPVEAEERLRLACWGDDYQLLFALADGETPAVAATRIGGFTAGGGLVLRWRGAPLALPASLGFAH